MCLSKTFRTLVFGVSPAESGLQESETATCLIATIPVSEKRNPAVFLYTTSRVRGFGL